MLSEDLKIITYNDSFREIFDIKDEKISHENLFKFNHKQWNIPKLKKNLKKISENKTNAIENLELNHEFPKLGEKSLNLNIRKVSFNDELPEMIIISIEEISDLQQTKQMLDKTRKEIEIRDKVSNIFLNSPEEEIYNEVLQMILEIIDSKIGYFGYINEDGDLVSPSLTSEVWEKCKVPDKDFVFSKEEWGGIWGESLENQKTIIKNEGLEPPKGHIALSNVICVPIMYQKDLIGQIVLGNKSSEYTKEDKEILEKIANQISPILHAKLEQDREEKERKKIEKELKRKKHKNVVDFVDKQIIKQLYKNGKLSLNEIKDKVVKLNQEKMSHTGINNRIDKLIDSNILKVQGNLNLKALEYQTAFVLIELQNYEKLENYIRLANECPDIFLLATTTGKYHLLIGIVGKNIEKINCCLNNCFLVNKEEIKNTELIFTPNLEIPEYIPINLFKNVNKDLDQKDRKSCRFQDSYCCRK